MALERLQNGIFRTMNRWSHHFYLLHLRHGNMGQSRYSAAKAGIVSMTALWAAELGRYGIRSWGYAAGFTCLPILEDASKDNGIV